jgi:hypothetical protein
MTDHFALFREERRPWLDPEKLKQKYYALSRAEPPGEEINQAFATLSDPRLRLHHLLMLEGGDLAAGRPVPPLVADLFWNTATLLRQIDNWLARKAQATSTLASALLKAEQAKLAEQLREVEEQVHARYNAEIAQIRRLDQEWNSRLPNDHSDLIELYDSIAYLTRLLEQVREKRFQLSIS